MYFDSVEKTSFFSFLTMVVFVEKQTFPEPPKDLIGFVQSVEQFLVVSVFLLYRFRGKLAPNKVNDS